MTNTVHTTSLLMTPFSGMGLTDNRKPVQVHIEATGITGDSISLRRMRRRNRLRRLH